MRTEYKSSHTDFSNGFAVEIKNAPLVRVRGESYLDVNSKVFTHAVLLALLQFKYRYCGAHIKMIRLSMGMTLQRFADLFGTTHGAILKWERARMSVTKMAWANEYLVRNLLAEHLIISPTDVAELNSHWLRGPALEVKQNIVVDGNIFKSLAANTISQRNLNTESFMETISHFSNSGELFSDRDLSNNLFGLPSGDLDKELLSSGKILMVNH